MKDLSSAKWKYEANGKKSVKKGVPFDKYMVTYYNNIQNRMEKIIIKRMEYNLKN